MVVRDDDKIDRRQLLVGQRWPGIARLDPEFEVKRVLGQMRVGQVIDIPVLHQRRRMSDPGHARHVGGGGDQLEVGGGDDRGNFIRIARWRVVLAQAHHEMTEEGAVLGADELAVAMVHLARVEDHAGTRATAREQAGERDRQDP